MLLRQPVAASDDEAHRLVGGVDHAELVGILRVVSCVKVFVDLFQELLLVFVGDGIGGGAADCGKIRFQP